MKRIFNFVRGISRLEISGAEPEKLLNMLAENGTDFWDASPKNNFSIELSVHSSAYPQILDMQGKYGCEIRLISDTGGRKILSAFRRRLSFLICFAASVSLLAASSLFVWRIDIVGNDTISDAELIRRLSECGLYYGCFWPSVSSDEVRNKVLLAEKDIAWLSVNIRSSHAEVLVHERKPKPDIVNKSEYVDIVATRSGIIEKLSILEGDAGCAVGDAVLKGETLISGTALSETGDTRFVHASGTVTARTWYDISAKTPLYEQRKTEIAHKGRTIYLQIGKKRIKIFGNSGNDGAACDKITKIRTLSFKDSFLIPLGIITERYCEYSTENVSIDEEKAIERLEKNLIDGLSEQICDGSIVSSEFFVTKDDGVLTVSLRAECIENIGAENDREND